MGRIRKSNTLSGIFMQYVLIMIMSFLALVVCTYVIFGILINTGYIYPANYTEQKINEAYSTIQNADEVTKDMIPALSHYVVFSANGEVLSGDMAEDSVKTAWNAVNGDDSTRKYFYKVVPRLNEYVVLQYSLAPQYHSAFLREHVVRPQNIMIGIDILGAIAIIVLPSISFGRKIRRKMQPLLNAIDKTKDQDLEYEVSYSGIKELDDCISSIDDMRSALKTSLEQQWKMEQDKNRQMSALAHDIKTPLTVVRGNSELLAETELTEQQRINVRYITDSALQIQDYVQKLIDVTKSMDDGQNIMEEVATEKIVSDIRKQAAGLAEVYGIKIDWKEQWHNKTVNVVKDQIVRAVLNIIQNAVEHTKKGGTISVSIKDADGRLTFTVEDTGDGFTREALLHGTEQFFMGDASRSGEAHYGIGLFFAETVAKRHGGDIRLTNSQDTGGAQVSIWFAVS